MRILYQEFKSRFGKKASWILGGIICADILLIVFFVNLIISMNDSLPRIPNMFMILLVAIGFGSLIVLEVVTGVNRVLFRSKYTFIRITVSLFILIITWAIIQAIS
ncbi:hypothetical protein CEN49_15100 [Fischerella thermalis CCMEE 5273]|nr:hypothetical protein CEN49_15100 [Fischerella thermalis CCMEE 5273]